ncbi:hypothetical protein O181_028912 [Austropuccinia psidii MF-1]|uniref:Integrase catalytic domain-containing protein n=1 Tax=Austropuccinia psidii MF-1 TaxID=1389203 RepID=A0A9Q3CVJ0_9BASI|nr:hypothetical protein [Austropuccinia psidii MF-1]
MGRLWIPTPSGVLELANFYYCPDIQSIILFLGRLIEDGYKPVFNGTALQLVSSNNLIYGTSYVNKCWYLDRSNLKINTICKIPSATAKSWHKQLGHASNAVVKNFLKRFVPEEKSDTWQDFFCEQCAKSKSTSVGSGPTIQTKMSSPVDLLVSDVARSFDKDPEGNWLLLTLRDHASTYTFTAALKSCPDVPNKIMTWIIFLFNMLHRDTAQLWTDNMGEYSGKLRKEIEGCRTLWLPTEPYLLDHNGEAERLNQTIWDMARTMLNASGLPSTFWSYTYSCATHVQNCLPNKRVAPLTSMEHLFGTEPCPSQLYPFGARAFVHVLSEKRVKLDPRATEGVLLTFTKSGKGWIFLNIPSKRIFNSTSAMFPDYQHLPVITSNSKGDVSFILNSLQLGEVPTD